MRNCWDNYVVAAEGDDLEIGAVVCQIDETAEAPVEEKTLEPEVEEATAKVGQEIPVGEKQSAHSTGGDVKATPVAEAIIEDKKVDSSKIEGSGSDGRITKSDVLEFLAGSIR